MSYQPTRESRSKIWRNKWDSWIDKFKRQIAGATRFRIWRIWKLITSSKNKFKTIKKFQTLLSNTSKLQKIWMSAELPFSKLRWRMKKSTECLDKCQRKNVLSKNSSLLSDITWKRKTKNLIMLRQSSLRLLLDFKTLCRKKFRTKLNTKLKSNIETNNIVHCWKRMSHNHN